MNTYMSAFAILLMNTIFMGTYSEQSQANNSAENETVADEMQPDFKTLDDRFSYAYGADLAEKFKEEGIELNVALLATAMQDVFADGDMKMSDGEIVATLEVYQEIHTKKKEAERALIGEKNQQEGEKFLAENARKDGVVVTESGLQYTVITEGDGGYTPDEDDEVTVHYRGRFIDGTEFDSTHARNEAYRARVKQLLEGWSEALQLMSEGAKWELYIPADLAYGERGSDPYVGPNAVLIFEVELLEIEKQNGSVISRQNSGDQD